MKFDDYNYEPHNNYILVDPTIEDSESEILGYVPPKVNKNDKNFGSKRDCLSDETKGPKLTDHALS